MVVISGGGYLAHAQGKAAANLCMPCNSAAAAFFFQETCRELLIVRRQEVCLFTAACGTQGERIFPASKMKLLDHDGLCGK